MNSMILSSGTCLRIVIIFFVFLKPVSAQVYPDKAVDKLLKQGIKSLINQDFASAKKYFNNLETKHPEIPAGKIYLAGTYIAEAYDKSEPYNLDIINKNLEAAIAQAETLVEMDKSNIWNIYFLALAKGYYAYYEALNENWLSAFSYGLSSVSAFEECLKLDSAFYEAFTATGTYKYWKSRKTEFLNWLPFIDDEKQSGIEYIQAAVENSNYNYYLGIYSLQWIYIDKGEPGKAVSISEKALEEFPNSRFFKWGYARALEDINLEKAVSVYYQILNSYKDKSNNYNEILLKHLIAQCYYKLGESEKALVLCNDILSIQNLSGFVEEKLGNRLERVRTLRKDILEAK
ncbi:MAG: hypothetical protein R6W90_18380 [Ignavibacteriaceae bacterium]